jgi:hypothetical protein
MVTTSLLGLDVAELLRKVEKFTGVKFPRDVVEVSLEPKLRMICIRFRKPGKAEFGEPIYPGVHLFSDKDTEEITAVEIIDLDKFGES